jgi:ABC-type multidrug transport system fused ATPase/permease subunit
MNELTFEKYISYRPKIYEHIIYWIMIIFYIIGCVLAVIFPWKYIPVFQNYIYNKGNDIVFSLYSAEIFSLSFFFFSLIFWGIIVSIIFSLFSCAKNAILWYEVVNSKTYDYNIYKYKNKRNIIFMVILAIIALFFSSISLFVHLRINDSGIYYNKIFEFKERYYGWNELKSVSIIPEITHGKSKILSPEMILEFGENKIDIWDGAGLGSPDSGTLIELLILIEKNTNIEFIVDNNFNDEIIDLLYNSSTEKKRNNILDVFNYLNNKQ